MGSACCTAVKDDALVSRAGNGALHRNALYSPSWSFRWDNRRRVAGEIEDSSYQLSREISSHISGEIKASEICSEREDHSARESPVVSFGTPIYQKSPIYDGIDPHMPPDLSAANNHSTEVKNLKESPEIAEINSPSSTPSTFSVLNPTTDPSSSQIRPHTVNSTPSRRARRSPGHQLFRQVSDSRILGLKSPNNNSISEGRPSFVLSTPGSQAGSFDGWSMRTFSELVASSQKERWSFDSERFGSGRGKISGSSSRFSYSPSIADLQKTCGACSKLLTERSSWRSNEVAAVAVLVCGHVYHSDCLETMTSEADKYDPTCPVCMVGEKQVWKMSKKALKAEAEVKARNNKKFRNRVVDSYLEDGFDIFEHGKGGKSEPGSSKMGSFAKPFLRRHFSLGSKWNRTSSENESVRKKGFWARYRKD